MSILMRALALCAATCGAAHAETRPQPRPNTAAAAPSRTPDSLAAWWVEFRPRALEAGIGAATLDALDLRLLPKVIERDRNQSEFTKTLWDYLGTAVSDLRVRNGRAALARHTDTLAEIEAAHGVPAEIVVAIWGLESAYGTFRGDTPTLSALATLAAEGRRAAFFETQLIAALRILEAGDVTPRAMRGSWAGAMGHTQFMPTSFLERAVDHDGDGRRDIWGDDPADALASTAAYLAGFGWRQGEPWGTEVALPPGFDYALSGVGKERPAAEWRALGLTTAAGAPLPDSDAVAIIAPAGHEGAAFARYPNFEVIERYNPADAYVIGVGHLADRIAGGAPIAGGWPEGDRALTRPERIELQERLTEAGFDPGGVDGLVGPLTLAAVQGWQAAQGLIPDGYPSPRLLDRMRR